MYRAQSICFLLASHRQRLVVASRILPPLLSAVSSHPTAILSCGMPPNVATPLLRLSYIPHLHHPHLHHSPPRLPSTLAAAATYKQGLPLLYSISPLLSLFYPYTPIPATAIATATISCRVPNLTQSEPTLYYPPLGLCLSVPTLVGIVCLDYWVCGRYQLLCCQQWSLVS